MSIEVGRCSNLANQGMTVQDAVTLLTERIDHAVTTLTAAMNTAVTGLREEMREMRLRIDDLDYNNRARLRNSAIVRPELIVNPLKNPDTHQLVELPNTARELTGLRVAEVERYLQELGQVAVGSADEKKT
ncbi:hypothetical protein F4801DRAFT_530318 [Xylaria longipes]|nr:hypothetical protein F4801DRAFT_530318 [Xylaria longipes]